MIKLIVSDLDGTLLKKDDTVEPKTLALLKNKMEQGVIFIMATGRDYNMVVDVMAENDLYSDMILNNGTEYRNLDGTIDEMHFMDDESLKEIVSILHQYDYHVSIHTNNGKYGLLDPEEYYQRHCKMLIQNNHVNSMDELPQKTFTTRNGFLRNYHHVTSIEEMLASGIRALKIDARHMDIKQVRGVKEITQKIPYLDISSSFEDNIEITTNTYNKASMIKKIMAEHNIKDDEVAIFGDGLNDACMLEPFQYSFVPANAVPGAKAVANYHLKKTADEGAVKEGIELLEQLQLI